LDLGFFIGFSRRAWFEDPLPGSDVYLVSTLRNFLRNPGDRVAGSDWTLVEEAWLRYHFVLSDSIRQKPEIMPHVNSAVSSFAAG
jgi:hypothetical protein